MCPFNINQFKSKGLVLGGARPSQFQIHLVPPAGTGNPEKITFVAEAASIPPANVGVVRIPYFGRMNPIAGDRDFPNWAVTIQNDEDFMVRSMMEQWSNRINELAGNVRLLNNGDMEDYMIDAQVQQFGKDGGLLREYTFVNLWPVSVEAIGLNWATQNQIETFAVNFAYWYWIPTIEGTYGSPTYQAETDTNDNGQ